MQIKVWGMSSSGNCHKVKLILDYLKIPYQWIETDTRHKATQTEEFRKMNANARVPLVQLEDGTYLPNRMPFSIILRKGRLFGRRINSRRRAYYSGCSSNSTTTNRVSL